MTEKEKSAYLHYLDQTRYERNSIRTSYDKGVFEGKIEGKIEEKIETAKKMIKDGMSVDIISKYTDLTAEQIREFVDK